MSETVMETRVGKPALWRFVLSRSAVIAAVSAVVVSAVTSSPGCSSSGEDRPGAKADPTRQLVLRSAAECVRRALESHQGDASTLGQRLDGFAQQPDDSARAAARDAFHTAMLSWQVLEVMQYGPAGAKDKTAGGQDLRDLLYSWPLVNSCRVDQHLVSQAYQNLASEPVNTRGLGAIAHLLFHVGPDNTCGAANIINTDGSWASITDLESTSRRLRGVGGLRCAQQCRNPAGGMAARSGF